MTTHTGLAAAPSSGPLPDAQRIYHDAPFAPSSPDERVRIGASLASRVVAYLPVALANRIPAGDSNFRIANSLSQAINSLDQFPGALFLADPGLDDGTAADAMVSRCDRVPSSMVVAYTHLTPDILARLVRLARVGVADVIVAGYDDTPSRFHSLVDQAAARPLTRYVTAQLLRQLRLAPASLRSSVESLFRVPLRFRTASDLAADASMPRRTLYRHLHEGGIKSPRLLVASGRVTHAITMMASGRTLRAASERFKYSRTEILAEQIATLTKLSPVAVRRGFDVISVAQSIIVELCAERGDDA